MTMEQLKRALELQHKQASERLALGLPIAPKEKPQRKYQNKVFSLFMILKIFTTNYRNFLL